MTRIPFDILKLPHDATLPQIPWAAFRAILARLGRRRKTATPLDALAPSHHRDLGLTPAEIQSISSVPLSVDAITILAIRDCGRTGHRRPGN
jgi:hypothetical protein